MLLRVNRSDLSLFAWTMLVIFAAVTFVRIDAAWGQRNERSSVRRGGMSARLSLDKGIRQFEKRKYWRAIKYFSAAIRKRPQNAIAYKLRGRAYHRLGIEGAAAKDFTRYLALKPADVRGYLLRGNARLLGNDLEGAVKDFSRAIELSPRSVEAYIGRGLALTGLQRYARAVIDYREAARLNPRSAEAAGNLGRAYMLAEKPRSAIAYLERAERMTINSAWKRQLGRWIDEVRKSLGLEKRTRSLRSRKPARRVPHRPLW
jgi:Flp pilus assembly protein TadD